MPRPHILAECAWPGPREARFDTAVLPWGATEAHNYHLPYGTDTIETEAVAARAAGKAWDRGARVVVLPAIPFGVQTGQLDIPFCLNLNPSTQTIILHDLLQSLEPHGITRLVVLNGHGGNDFKQIIRELQAETAIFLCQVNWYAAVDPRPFFDEPGDHAGELETSVMQQVAPSLVRPLDQAGPGRARPFRIEGLRTGVAWAPRRWTEATEDTGVGNPRAATAEKGARFLEAVTDRIADFLVDLSAADLAALYER